MERALKENQTPFLLFCYKLYNFSSIVEHTAIKEVEARERYKRHLAEIVQKNCLEADSTACTKFRKAYKMGAYLLLHSYFYIVYYYMYFYMYIYIHLQTVKNMYFYIDNSKNKNYNRKHIEIYVFLYV